MTSQSTETRRGPEPPDISEKGGIKNGQPQRSDRRLFMQLLAFGGCHDVGPLAETLSRSDLEDVLLQRPRRTVLNPAWRWAVWYPLRRSGRFVQLPVEEQRVILAEHGA